MRSGVKMPPPTDQPWNEKISDLMKEARKADRVDKERAELFEGMMKTPAWKSYVELLELRLQLFADVVLQPSTSIDGSIALERSEEHTSELQSRQYLVCRLLLEKKKKKK